MEKTASTIENQIVVFYINGEEYGIDIQKIMTIEKLHNITRVPHAPAIVNGVINLRGEIISVIDMSKRLKMGEVKFGDNTRIIIFKIEELSIGFIVDQVVEVLSIEQDQIESTNVIDSNDSNNEYLEGIGKVNGRIISILNLDKLIVL